MQRDVIGKNFGEGNVTMFDINRFIENCKAAVVESDDHTAVREVVEEAMADPSGVMEALGEPKKSEIQKIYASDELTIINVVWAPWMTAMPHNHEMWAVIGIYSGREDNMFWRRITDAKDGKIEAAGARALCKGDVAPLGRDIIHSVTNPIPRLTGAIHVYGGNFFSVLRSEWDPETLLEEPYNVEKNLKLFEDFGRMTGT